MLRGSGDCLRSETYDVQTCHLPTKHELGKGLHFITRIYKNGMFATVCEDWFGPSLGPDEETIPKREECLVGKALKRKFIIYQEPWLNAQQNKPTTI